MRKVYGLLSLRGYFQRLFRGPLVRPWALSGPILILVICLPLLRPLRHPGPAQISDTELATLATVQALAEHRTLAIDQTSFAHTREKIRSSQRGLQGIQDDRGERLYSSQPPVQGALLAGCYWLMTKLGLSFAADATLVTYLLTLLGVTLPVALSAGLIYRMGRLFELPRPWRAGLGVAVVLSSGLVSYAVVLNPHAPAAALLLLSASCLAYLTNCPRPWRSGAWIAGAGFFASLAAVVDLPAVVFLLLLMFCILAMRWPASQRVGGLLLYVLGALPPLALHAALVLPVTGDLLPGSLHPELAVPVRPSLLDGTADLADGGQTSPPASAADQAVLEGEEWDSVWASVGRGIGRILTALLGAHGLLTHFPVLIVSLIGSAMVLHRHWPAPTKALAGATLAGSALIILCHALAQSAGGGSWPPAMFAARWFILFLPLLVFWAGAWLRRRHAPVSWAAAGGLLGFSVVVSLLGATNPLPPEGFDRYTPVAVLKQLVRHPPPDHRGTQQETEQGTEPGTGRLIRGSAGDPTPAQL